MALNLFYITNRPDVAAIAEECGVDRIWIDLETLGKEERQQGINTVKSNHTIEDILRVKSVLSSSEVLVRVNPWNKKSVQEINAVVEAGADIIMLPMWRSAEDVLNFLTTINGRTKTTLLLETKEAVECVDDVLKLDFDEIHIGLNDLHLSYGMNFMFELLANGTVEMLCHKFHEKGIPYGFGGIARLGAGILKSENVIMEHYRLGSTRAILSRSFCDVYKLSNREEIEKRFRENVPLIRQYENYCSQVGKEEYQRNHRVVVERVAEIVNNLNTK